MTGTSCGGFPPVPSRILQGFFLLLVSYRPSVSEVNVTMVSFQVDGRATIESMADTGIGLLPDLSQVTICVRYRLLHSGYSGNPIISYFAGGIDNQIFLSPSWTEQRMELRCCSFRVIMDFPVPVQLYRWHHACLAMDLTARKYWFAYDDTYKEDVIDAEGTEELKIVGGGRLVMGQDLDNLNGAFNSRQSIHGDIAQFQLFEDVLDPQYLKDYVKCSTVNTNKNPILDFNEKMDLLEVTGSTNVSQIPLTSLCSRESYTLVMLPEKRDYESAYVMCSTMKGHLFIAESQEENTKVFDEVIIFNSQCVDAYGTLYWVGLEGILETGQWLTVTEHKEPVWSNFGIGFESVTFKSQCVSVGGADFPYEWYATPCHYLTCPLCKFPNTPRFKVRGLCKDSLVDKSLFLHGYMNDKPHFQGDYVTSIAWDTVNNSWVMTSRANQDFAGHLISKGLEVYPVGIHLWTFSGDKCILSETEVLITACGEREYTCNDGTCIQKTQRCDRATDCSDLSDELNCQIAVIPSGYSVEIPPPKDLDKPVPVRIFVEITSVREINILGFKMVLDIILNFYWKDRRLQMKNLREDVTSNKVQDPKQLWIPRIQVEDGSRSLADFNMRSEALLVLRESSPIPDDDVRLSEDDIYVGANNSLMLQQVNTLSFTCQFQLQLYPFDTQVCSITFHLIDVSSMFVVLTKDDEGVTFTGQKKLLEYRVTTVNMSSVVTPGKVSQKVMIQLENLYGYYVSSTYIPTLLLVIICYLTLFFDINDFTDRVMVSLTSLLVLAALFSQTSQTIPKTAYLKLIDLWFVFLIVTEFLIVLILVIIENLRLRKHLQTHNARMISVRTMMTEKQQQLQPDFKSPSDRVTKSASLANYLAVVIIPLIMIVFIIGYISVCASSV